MSAVEIPRALSSFSSFILGLSDLSEEELGEIYYITHLDIKMPMELEVNENKSGKIDIFAGPPTQRIETTFMPVFHSVRMKVISKDEKKD